MAGERRSPPRAPAAVADREAGMIWLRAIGKMPGQIASWLGERFELEDSVMAVLRHPVPRGPQRPLGWGDVVRSAAPPVFVLPGGTRGGVAMTDVPAPNRAERSVQFITHR